MCPLKFFTEMRVKYGPILIMHECHQHLDSTFLCVWLKGAVTHLDRRLRCTISEPLKPKIPYATPFIKSIKGCSDFGCLNCKQEP